MIKSHYLGYSPNEDRKPLGTFVCHDCGFTYSRIGPDRDANDSYRIGRVVTQGYLLLGRLKELWKAGYSEKYIAKQLMVHPETVKRQLSRLGLIPTPDWLELKIDLNASRFLELELEECRKSWRETISRHPTAKMTDLMSISPQVYWTLYRLDAIWLEQTKPDPARSGQSITPQRVDWAERDNWLGIHGPIAAAKIRDQRDKLLRVTLNQIAKELGWHESAITKNKDRLPNSYKLLSEILESHTEFALRRIQYVRELYRTEGVIPTMAAFIKRAGLSKSLQTQQIISCIENLLMN